MQPVGEGLRAGGLDGVEAHLVLLEVLQPGEPLLLGPGQPVEFGRVSAGEGDQTVDVDADDPVRCPAPHLGGDPGSAARPLDAVGAVAEPVHQLDEGARNAPGGPAGLGERAGEARAGCGGHDDVEVLRQGPDDVDELHERAGPVMHQEQRDGGRVLRADVQEVDVLAVDLGGELGEFVEFRLRLAPVEAVGPVRGQGLEVVGRHPPAPAGAGDLAAPAGARQPVVQVVELVLRDVDAVRADPGVGVAAGLHG